MIARTIGGPARRIDLPVRFHDGPLPVDLPDALAQKADELVECSQLPRSRRVVIEIADEANAERDVIQVIAMHVATRDLPPPAISDFDFAVTGRAAVADHKMVGESIRHMAHVQVVVVKCARISLPRAGIVHDDVAPAMLLHRSPLDFRLHGFG